MILNSVLWYLLYLYKQGLFSSRNIDTFGLARAFKLSKLLQEKLGLAKHFPLKYIVSGSKLSLNDSILLHADF